jgi:cyanophycinase
MKKIAAGLAGLALSLLAASIGPSRGALVIAGGGKLAPQVRQRFVALAGGPDANFVTIPTAIDDKTLDLGQAAQRFQKYFGANHVTVLHTRDRAEADSEAFTAPLRRASGVWLEGGRQWRLADAYLNTRTEREIKAVLARGGVIGGTSAGATIQGSYLVRGALEGNSIMMAPGHEQGFGLLRMSPSIST